MSARAVRKAIDLSQPRLFRSQWHQLTASQRAGWIGRHSGAWGIDDDPPSKKRKRRKARAKKVDPDTPVVPVPLPKRSPAQERRDVARCKPRLWVFSIDDGDWRFHYRNSQTIVEHVLMLRDTAPGALAVFAESGFLIENIQPRVESNRKSLLAFLTHARESGAFTTARAWHCDTSELVDVADENGHPVCVVVGPCSYLDLPGLAKMAALNNETDWT